MAIRTVLTGVGSRLKVPHGWLFAHGARPPPLSSSLVGSLEGQRITRDGGSSRRSLLHSAVVTKRSDDRSIDGRTSRPGPGLPNRHAPSGRRLVTCRPPRSGGSRQVRGCEVPVSIPKADHRPRRRRGPTPGRPARHHACARTRSRRVSVRLHPTRRRRRLDTRHRPIRQPGRRRVHPQSTAVDVELLVLGPNRRLTSSRSRDGHGGEHVLIGSGPHAEIADPDRVVTSSDEHIGDMGEWSSSRRNVTLVGGEAAHALELQALRSAGAPRCRRPRSCELRAR